MINKERPRCFRQNCEKPGISCYTYPDQDKPDIYYCFSHMLEHLFCINCQTFAGHPDNLGDGYCIHCRKEFKK